MLLSPAIALAILAFLAASFGVCWLLLASRRAHDWFTVDGKIPGLQKVHRTPVPRIGGFGILAGVAAGAVFLGSREEVAWMALFLLAAMPAFVGGFLEDLTRRVSPYSRLLFVFGAAQWGTCYWTAGSPTSTCPATITSSNTSSSRSASRSSPWADSRT